MAVEVWSGFAVPEIKFLNRSTRFNVMEGNRMVAVTTALYQYNVVDLHYYLQSHLHGRRDDGIHWTPRLNRFMVNLILTHYSKSINIPIPGHGPATAKVTGKRKNDEEEEGRRKRP